jgi:hypothetical protein
MATLRLAHRAIGTGHVVELALDGAGPPLTAKARFHLDLTAQDREDIRWYLEDYLQYPAAPAPLIAQRVEGRIGALGRGALSHQAARLAPIWHRYISEGRVPLWSVGGQRRLACRCAPFAVGIARGVGACPGVIGAGWRDGVACYRISLQKLMSAWSLTPHRCNSPSWGRLVGLDLDGTRAVSIDERWLW